MQVYIFSINWFYLVFLEDLYLHSPMVVGKIQELWVRSILFFPDIITYIVMLFFIALSLLSPKEIDKYTDMIYKESSIFVDTVLDSSIKNDGIVPFDYLDFYALNTVTNITFGKRFQSQQNPEYRTLCSIAKDVVLFGSVTNNLQDYLPVVSIVQYFCGTQSKMKKFIETKRNPIFQKLIEDASETEGINMVKTLDGKSFDLSDEEKVALICKLYAYISSLRLKFNYYSLMPFIIIIS